MNTILGGAAGGLSSMLLKPFIHCKEKKPHFDMTALCNGLIAGLVGITAGCDAIDPWAAVVIGLIAGLIYASTCYYLKKMNIDDPIEAANVHGFCGMWGLLATAIFSKD
jgi:Amt family ammonium transporter